MNRWGIVLFSCLLFVLLAEPTFAHKASDSYLRFTIEGNAIQGEWDIALRDIDYAMGLDGNGDGQITWGEVRANHQAMRNYALSRLHITREQSTCWHNPTKDLVDQHTDGAYAVIRFGVVCPETMGTLQIEYGLLFDLDPLHRGLLHVAADGHVQTGIFSPEHPTIRLNPKQHSPWHELFQFGREGVWHIWIGYDHILFLISLLLPAVLWWREGHWHPQQTFRPALREALKIVTAFTVAHSMTLSLAVLGFVSLPSRWIESTIAASVLLAALHNFYPVFRTHLWIMIFIFGLIHGLGFASVLIDLGVPGQSLALALAGFNIGVEIGQVVIVGLFIPLAFLIRRSWSYQRIGVQVGSLMIAVIAFVWFIERSMNVNIGMGVW
ncbi:HupE/UreJ family protein [Nitrospira sp. M1]